MTDANKEILNHDQVTQVKNLSQFETQQYLFLFFFQRPIVEFTNNFYYCERLN